MTQLYGEFQNGETYLLSLDAERDAVIAQMSLSEYISEINTPAANSEV